MELTLNSKDDGYMSNDNNHNKTQSNDKSKLSLPDLDACMERLKAVSGQTHNVSALRWLGLSNTTYANWKRRQVNYGALAKGLLARGISLDWFFAPNVDLRYPGPDELPRIQEVAESYTSTQRTQRVIRAIERIDPVLQEHQLPATESNRAILVETYFTARRGFVPLPTALTQVTKALKQEPDRD
ncbi:MAG: hypothetical protein WEA82_06765 [Idiomarina sp.]